MFTKKSDTGFSNPLAGITMKTLVHGEKTLMTQFVLEQGSLLPPHSHPHEQTGFLVSGRLELAIGGERHDVRPEIHGACPAMSNTRRWRWKTPLPSRFFHRSGKSTFPAEAIRQKP
jgi:hypothetical protein